MNGKEPSDAAYDDADDLEVEVDLDDVPDAPQQGSMIVGGGADAAKAYVAPIAVPARIESKPTPPAEGKVRIDSRVDPRRMPTVKISARQLAAGAIPGWRPGGPAVEKPAESTRRPDWMVPPEGSEPAAPAPARPRPPAPSMTATSSVLWMFAIVLTACAVGAVGAVLWVELTRKPAPPPASSITEVPISTATSSVMPQVVPVVSAATAAPSRSGSKRTAPKPRATGR